MNTIAAFDFDKTITTRDSLLPFLGYVSGWAKTCGICMQLMPYFIGFELNLVERQQVKEKVLTSFFKGMSLSSLKEKGKFFADLIVDQYVKKHAIERIRWHQQQGHRCILISASLDVYLYPWAKRYGFQDIISSSLDVDENGDVTGKLDGLNCWGPEKASRLKKLLNSTPHKLYVYGDSLGDKDILDMADYPYYRRFS